MSIEGSESEAVRELLATVLHEVRTPLACLATTVDVLVAAYPDLPEGDALAMLRRVQRSASWLQNLIDNLTVAAQLESRQLHLRSEDLPLRDCIDTARSLVAPLLERSGQVLILEGDLDADVHGDARRIEQVLVNLVMNASKYGGEHQSIKINVTQETDTVRVTVTDRGPGIGTEEQARIFERYQRGSSAEQRGVTGLGLGLHIVKTLVEHLGGEVGVRSSPGQGASFWFVLPRPTPKRAACRGRAGRSHAMVTVGE